MRKYIIGTEKDKIMKINDILWNIKQIMQHVAKMR